MSLTKQNIEQLLALDIQMDSDKLTYIHSFSFGLDYPDKDNKVAAKHDFTVYHAAVADTTICPESDIHPFVASINSRLPASIEKFIQKWLDKDFKFT